MSTSAELYGPVSHINYSYGIAVLFSEECHRTGSLGFLDAHNVGNYSEIICYLLVNDLFNLGYLLGCHCLTVAEVETCPGRILV